PAVAPIMWLGMAAAAVAQVSVPMAGLLDVLALYPLAYLEWLAHAAASVPHAAVPVRLGSAGAMVGVYAAVALALRRRKVRRAIAVVALAAVAVAGALHLRD